MADAKWAQYREPEPLTGREAPGHATRRRLDNLRKATRGEGGPDAGSSTGVGSSRRGGSRTLHGGDENMDGGSGSRRFDVLNRRGRPNAAASRQPVENKQHVEMIQDFVRRKYNPASQFLSFDDIFGDQILRANGLTKFNAIGNQDKLADALWKAAGELDPPVSTVSAARNNMTRVQIQQIHKYLPGLRNLSLRDNDLETLGDVSHLFTRNRSGGLRHLQEIWLVGNNLRAKFEKFGDLDQYFYALGNAIRTLKVVDGLPVPSASWDIEEVPAATRQWPSGQAYPVSFPVPMAPSSVDDHLRDMIGGILSQFFAFYDNDRKNLINAYHPEATFSVSSMPNTPPRQIITQYQPEKGTAASLTLLKNLQETGLSRNLKFITGAQIREVSLHSGARAILESFESLPPSRHPLQDGSKFVFDATVLPDMGTGDMLEVSVHGEFTEPHMNVVFSFNRSFVFVTAPPGSTAEKIGMNVLVLSDILTLRRLSPSSVWQPGPIMSQGDEWSRQHWPLRNQNPPPARPHQPAPPQPAPAPMQQPAQNPFQQPAPNPFQQPQNPIFQQPPVNPFQQPMAQPMPQPMPQPPPQPVPLQQPMPQAPLIQQPQPIAPPVQQQMQPPAPTPAAGPAEVPSELASLPPGQQELAMAFSSVTGLVLGATVSVLGEVNWDGNLAYARLLEVKGSIPGEWWVGGAPKI